MQIPAGVGDWLIVARDVLRRMDAPLLVQHVEQQGRGLLDRVVVPVACLSLAILEWAFTGIAPGEEQIGVGVAGAA